MKHGVVKKLFVSTSVLKIYHQNGNKSNTILDYTKT